MRILVLHQNKFERMGYTRCFDHDDHDVVYAGTAEYVADVPPDIRCGKHEWRPDRPVVDQLRPWLAAQPPFDRIIARHELLVLPAAQLRAELGIPGMRPQVAIRFRDKVRMKDTLAEAGIRVPRFYPVTALPERAPWPGKVIIKPRDANASQGVVLCADYASARELVEERRRVDDTFATRYEVEEFLDGPIWTVDGFLFRGEPVAAQAARYVGTCLDFEHGRPFGAVQHPAPNLEAWACACVRALGGQTLSFHLEAIMTAEGPAFLEVAARCGGGYLVAMVHRRTGVHLHTVDWATDVRGELAVDLITEPEPGIYYGDFLYPGHTYGGAPVTVTVAPEVLADPVLLTYQTHPDGEPTTTKAGYRPENLAFSGLIGGPDPDELETWIRRLFRTVTVSALVPR